MTQRVTAMQAERVLEPAEQLSDEGEIAERCASGDQSALLTDLQRAALRWMSSYERSCA